MELDGYAPSLSLAFEYHGEQHYLQNAFFHNNPAAFQRRLQDDEQKRQLCRQHGVALLEIPYSIPHGQLQAYLTGLLRSLGCHVIRDESPIEITELDVWRRKDIGNLRALAISRGGSLISNYYINNSTKLRWRCADGHEWEAILQASKGVLGARSAGTNEQL